MSTSAITSNAGQAAISAMKTGSGIDIQSLATDLTNATKAASQSSIDTRRAAAQAQISSVAKVMSAVDLFLTSLKEVGDATTFQREAYSGDTAKVAVANTSDAPPADFSASVEVTQLARTASVLFASVSSLDDSLLGADGLDRTLTFTEGTSASPGSVIGTAITIDSSTTLLSLRDQINSISGLSAVIVNAGSASSPQYRLSVKGGSGADETFFATVANSDASTLASDGLQSPTATAGLDATITVDGLSVSSSSNTFDSVIEGISLTVSALTSGTAVTIGSRTNSDALTTAAATIVSGFNIVLDTIKAESVYDLDPKKRGGLSNNSATTSLLNQLRRFTTQPVAGYSSTSYTMAEIGIKTNRDGKLSLDTTRFAALLKSDPGMVEAVLASKRSVADARLTVAAVTDDTEPGIYEIAKTASGWTIGGTAATLTGTRLVAASGSTQDGLTIIIPTAVQTLASVGYSTEVSYSAGMLERFTDMLGDLKDSQSSLSRLSSNSTQAVSKLDTEQQKLDERADQIKARYLKQFAAMDGLVGRGKSTQDSLTNFMTAWSNSLK